MDWKTQYCQDVNYHKSSLDNIYLGDHRIPERSSDWQKKMPYKLWDNIVGGSGGVREFYESNFGNECSLLD